MSDTRKVTIKNMSNATVTLHFRNSNFKRVMRGEGAKIDIPFDTLYDGIGEPGVEFMFTKGYLAIPEKQDRIDLGLESEDSVASMGDLTLGSKEMLAILTEGDPVKIKATLSKLAPSQQKKFANVAITNEIYSMGIAKLINDYTGIDLAKAIAAKKDEQE